MVHGEQKIREEPVPKKVMSVAVIQSKFLSIGTTDILCQTILCLRGQEEVVHWGV